MRLDLSNRRIVPALVVAFCVLGLWTHLGAASDADPGSDAKRLPLDEVLAVSIDPMVDPKGYWQERYTKLLRQRAVEDRVIERERELYADANRRNYRRGKKRHVHRDAMQEAMARKGEVEDRLDAFQEEARRAGVLPGWLYEVEDGWRDAPIAPPAVITDAIEEPLDDGERAGRNPLYLDDEADE